MATALPILYSFRRCPYAMRARLALVSSGLVCALREVILARKPAALLQASPKGTVPVLVHADGTVLEQSLDIMLWALRMRDPNGWLPRTETAMAETLALIANNDGAFKHHLDRYKYPNRYGLQDGTEDRTAGMPFLHSLNARLLQQGFLAGPGFGLADAALAPFVRQFAHTDPVWFAQQPWPALNAWLVQFEQSPVYLHAMAKFPAWAPEQRAVLFPELEA